MRQLKHLRHIDISYNCFTHVPDVLKHLDKISHLNLSYNPIRLYPSSHAFTLMNLGLLNLSGTLIDSLPCELAALVSTCSVLLHDCPHLLQDTIHQPSISQPPSLKEICSRSLVRPLLCRTKDAKPKLKAKLGSVTLPSGYAEQLPLHLAETLRRPQACSFCNAPFFADPVIRFRFVSRNDASEDLVALRYTLCSAHWQDDDDRYLAYFSSQSTMRMPIDPSSWLKHVPLTIENQE